MPRMDGSDNLALGDRSDAPLANRLEKRLWGSRSENFLDPCCGLEKHRPVLSHYPLEELDLGQYSTYIRQLAPGCQHLAEFENCARP